MGATDLHNTLIMVIFKIGPSRLLVVKPKIIYSMLMNNSVMVRQTNQAISGENFSQSEYVAVSAIFQFAFLMLTRSDPSCIPLCKSFEHVWQTSIPVHKSFEHQFLYSHSISSNPHVLLAEAHNKYCFEAVSIAENSTDPYVFARID